MTTKTFWGPSEPRPLASGRFDH